MLQAVIFDFDGVVTDSEPLHYQALMRTLRGRGIEFDWEIYCEKYLAYDDRDLFRHVMGDAGKGISDQELGRLMEDKNAQVLAAIRAELAGAGAGSGEGGGAQGVVLPGVTELLADLARHEVPVGLCSGARRNEVELFLGLAGLRGYFRFLVTADDVAAAKPDPEGYRKSLELLELHVPGPVEARRCVAIEDSPGGLRAARGAGLTTLGVMQEYPVARLEAELVVDDLTVVDVRLLGQLVEHRLG